MRFHVLGLPHTVSTPEFSACAFTTKTVKMCKMLKMSGHTVFHYGHQDSNVECDEHVTVVKRYDYGKSYPNHDWRKKGWPDYDVHKDWAYEVFNNRTPAEIMKRFEPGDFLLCTFGWGHKRVADQCPQLIAVEPGIGYPTGGWARFRVFESNSIRSAYIGQKWIGQSQNNFWYDAVIPNYFDLSEFPDAKSPCLHEVRSTMGDMGDIINNQGIITQGQVGNNTLHPKGQVGNNTLHPKDDYLLFVGRVNTGKGIHICEQIAEDLQTKLIVAGAGDYPFKSPYVERVGVVDPAKRMDLMSNARAVLCPSTFMEPFCGVQIEAMLCGTPVISSDWGAFCEYNIHGRTGYRCQTFEQFTWAVANAGVLDPADCRAQGERFSLENIAPMFDEYFFSVQNCINGKGWYTKVPSRSNLDFTTLGADP